MHELDSKSGPPLALHVAAVLGWLVWQAVRWPVLALLVVLEPVVRIGLAGFALIGTLIAFFFEFLIARPDFPFLGMLAVSLGAYGVLALYYGLIRLLSPN